jgi:hypothetical protein
MKVTSHKGGYLLYLTGYYNASLVGGVPGTGFNEPEALTMSGLAGGGGGGSGANGGYDYNSGSSKYFYGSTSGGGGAGAVGIETAGTFSMGSTGVLKLTGGTGGSYCYTSVVGAGAGGAGGTALVRADTITLTSGATIDARGGAGGLAYSGSTSYYHYGNDGGVGGVGAARFEAVTLPGIFNNSGILGYSSTTGSLYTSTFTGGGDTGATAWTTAAGLAPDFHSSSISSQGSADLQLEGAMADPFTGLRSATRVGLQSLSSTPLTQGLGTPDSIDGFVNYRVLWKLSPPSSAVPALPEVYDSSLSVDTK